MARLFKRRVRVSVTALQPGEGEYIAFPWDLDTQKIPLRIDFNLSEYTAYPFPKGELKMYNLSPESRNLLASAVDIHIAAGYESEGIPPLLFKGTPRWAESKNIGEDVVTTILLGGRLEFDQRVELSYESEQKVEDVVQEIINQAADQVNVRTFGLVVSDLKLGPLPAELQVTQNEQGERKTLTTPESWSANGTMSNVLTDLLDDYNLVWHCTETGEIHVLRERLPAQSPSVRIDPQNGMVGEPTVNKDGITVKTLLDPRVRLRTFIDVKSERVDLQGISRYTPTQVTHQASTWENTWYTTVEAIA